MLSKTNIFFQYSRANKKSSELHVKDCVLIKVVIQNTCLTRAFILIKALLILCLGHPDFPFAFSFFKNDTPI